MCVCFFCLFICCIQLLKLSSCFSLVIKNFKTSEMRLHEQNPYAFFLLRQSALFFIIRRAHSRIMMIISLLDQHRICVLAMYLLKSVQDAAADAPSFLMENKLNQNGKIERALCTILSGILECNTWKCGCVILCCDVMWCAVRYRPFILHALIVIIIIIHAYRYYSRNCLVLCDFIAQ